MNAPEHLSREMLADYRARRMSPARILAALDHAGQCTGCSDLLEQSMVLEHETAIDEHLSEQDAVDFVTGKLYSPEVEDHVADCDECRATIEDLKLFRREEKNGMATPRNARRKWLWAVAILMIAAGTWLTRSNSGTETRGTPVSLNDESGVIAIDSSGHLSGLEGLSQSHRKMIEQALRAGQWPESADDVARLHPDGGFRGTLRSLSSNGDKFAVLAPVGSHEYQDRPLFRWSPLPGATEYEVTVLDEDHSVVMRSGQIHGTDWRPSTPLPRLRYLLWHVETQTGDQRVSAPAPPETDPVFQILGVDAARAIETARTAEKPSHLLLALLYAQQGMRENATAEMTKLEALNPGSPIVEALEQGAAAAK